METAHDERSVQEAWDRHFVAFNEQDVSSPTRHTVQGYSFEDALFCQVL